MLDAQRDLVLRPALVLGRGGLAQSMCGLIKRLPLVPLIGGGGQMLRVVGVDEVCSAVATLLEHDVSGNYDLAAAQPVSLRAFYEGVARRLGVRRVFVPVPVWPMYLAMRAVEWCGIELPVTSENLLGLMQLPASDARAGRNPPGIHPRPFEETL